MKKPTLHEKFFAWLHNKFDSRINSIFEEYKIDLFEDIKGNVLEIGPGTGSNFSYYDKQIKWIGVEPNLAMHEYLQKKAENEDIHYKLIKGKSEEIDVPDNSMDFVVSTLVLCSVEDLEKTLKEIKRVLRPKGKFIFLEHVGANKKTFLRKMQDVLNPAWKKVALGCNLNRETRNILKKVFDNVKIRKIKDRKGITSPIIYGVASK